MTEVIDNQKLTPSERLYREYMKAGDDFTKIEIFRSAAAWYKKALDLRPDDGEARQKLAGIQEKIKKENRAIYTIVAIFAVAVILVVVLV